MTKTIMTANVINAVFKDPSRINHLIAKGYRVVAMGGTVRGFGTGLINANGNARADFGAHDHPVYLVIDKANGQRDVDDIGFVNVDLHECRFKYESPHMLPRWSKLRVQVNYPFSVYIYIPGDGTIDGLGPEVDGFEFPHMVDNLPANRDAGAKTCWSVSYINLHSGDADVHRSWFRPWNTHEVNHTDPDALVLSAQHECLPEPMEAVMNL